MMTTSSNGNRFQQEEDLERLLLDGLACLGFSGLVAEHSLARRTIDLRGVPISVIAIEEVDELADHDFVLAAPMYGVEASVPEALEFLFEINLANALAGAGAFGRDKEGNLLLLKAMRSDKLDGMTLAAHMQWMVALVESVRDELRKLH